MIYWCHEQSGVRIFFSATAAFLFSYSLRSLHNIGRFFARVEHALYANFYVIFSPGTGSRTLPGEKFKIGRKLLNAWNCEQCTCPSRNYPCINSERTMITKKTSSLSSSKNLDQFDRFTGNVFFVLIKTFLQQKGSCACKCRSPFPLMFTGWSLSGSFLRSFQQVPHLAGLSNFEVSKPKIIAFFPFHGKALITFSWIAARNFPFTPAATTEGCRK